MNAHDATRPGQQRRRSHLPVSRPTRPRDLENLYRNSRILVTALRQSSRHHHSDLLRTFRMAQGRTSTTHYRHLQESSKHSSRPRRFGLAIAPGRSSSIWVARYPTGVLSMDWQQKDRSPMDHSTDTKALGCYMGSVGTSQPRVT
jgi:hypothetical protein